MQYNGLNLTTSPASYCASMHCTSARCCFLLGAFYYLRDTQKCSSHGREPLRARPIVPHFRKASQRRRRTGFESDSLRSLNDTGAHVDECAVSFGFWSATCGARYRSSRSASSPMTVRGDRRDEVVQRGAANRLHDKQRAIMACTNGISHSKFKQTKRRKVGIKNAAVPGENVGPLL